MKLTDKQIDKEMASYFKEQPTKMMMFMIAQAGKQAVSANAETMDLSCEANVGDRRYKIEVFIKVKEIGEAIPFNP